MKYSTTSGLYPTLYPSLFLREESPCSRAFTINCDSISHVGFFLLNSEINVSYFKRKLAREKRKLETRNTRLVARERQAIQASVEREKRIKAREEAEATKDAFMKGEHECLKTKKKKKRKKKIKSNKMSMF